MVFRNVVKLLKFFAKQKGIYGSNYCFFNGMTLQIMTLYVMELLYEDPDEQYQGFGQHAEFSNRDNLFYSNFPNYHSLVNLKD